MFTKKDLQVGMIVGLRDERKFMVMPTRNGIFMIYEKGEYVRLNHYTEVLYCKKNKNLDIMKVWGLSDYRPLVLNVDGRTLLWQREEPKYHVTLPAGTFEQTGRYLKYDKGSKSYFFGSKYEIKPDEFECGIKTKFTQEEANEVKNIIKSSIEVVEIEGGQGNE